MTKDEALRLALEKLTVASNYIDTLGGVSKSYRMDIENLKAALEANEFNPDWDTQAVLVEEIQRMAKRIEELEAKDEPVAWRDAAIRLGEELSSVGPDGYYDMDAKEWLDWAIEQNPRGKHSLPQRTWVGLKDDDEIDWDGGDLKSFVKAIEAKLKERNHD